MNRRRRDRKARAECRLAVANLTWDSGIMAGLAAVNGPLRGVKASPNI